MYHGFWGKKLLLMILIIGILVCIYCWCTGNRILFAVSVSGNIFLWIGFWVGLIEGTYLGRYLDKTEPEDDPESDKFKRRENHEIM